MNHSETGSDSNGMSSHSDISSVQSHPDNKPYLSASEPMPHIMYNSTPHQLGQPIYDTQSSAQLHTTQVSEKPPEEKWTKFTSKHTTNRHHFKDKFEKKRKVNVRACDLCAARKVRCDTKRPCTNCVQNNLECTSLRERKKSGPKNNKIDIYNLEELSPEVEEKEYMLTPSNLVENLALIAEEPIIFELLKPLTVQSLIINHVKLVDFIKASFKDEAMDRDINLVQHHENPLFLSHVLVVLTANLIIAEILIKLKKQRFRDFTKYPKRNLATRNFKNFKNYAHLKCIEITSMIEKNFIVPPIVSPPTGSNNPLSSVGSYQIYYNLSLSFLHMCNYYHCLNLNNTLNASSNLESNYGNEIQEHQKIINLRRSISYFQLINIKTTDSADMVQLCELYENLVTFETFYLVYSTNNYNLNVLRNNDIFVQLNSKRISRTRHETIKNSFNPNTLYLLMGIIREEAEHSDLMTRLAKHTNFNVLLKTSEAHDTYHRIKNKLMGLVARETIFELIRLILIFKLLLIYPLDERSNRVELLTLMKEANTCLDSANSDLFKIQMSNYQLLQPLLHLLKITLDMREARQGETGPALHASQGPRAYVAGKDDEQLIMIRYSDNLIKHFPFFNNINKLIRSSKFLNEWFLHLNDNRQKLTESAPLKATEQSPVATSSSDSIQYHDLPTPLQNANFPYMNDNLPENLQPTAPGSYSELLQLSQNPNFLPMNNSTRNLYGMFAMEEFDGEQTQPQSNMQNSLTNLFQLNSYLE